MKSVFHLLVPFTAIISVFCSSCASNTASVSSAAGYLADYRTPQVYGPNGLVTQPVQSATEEKGYWDGDGVQGAPMIKVNLADQKAYFYKGNEMVGQSPISSGKEGKRTPRGRYKVTERDVDHVSSLYGVIKDNATGAVVNDKADTRKHKALAGQTFVNAPMNNFLRFNGAIGMHTGHLPGYPASAGCVRLPDNMAKVFYENAPLGTPVIVE